MGIEQVLDITVQISSCERSISLYPQVLDWSKTERVGELGLFKPPFPPSPHDPYEYLEKPNVNQHSKVVEGNKLNTNRQMQLQLLQARSTPNSSTTFPGNSFTPQLLVVKFSCAEIYGSTGSVMEAASIRTYRYQTFGCRCGHYTQWWIICIPELPPLVLYMDERSRLVQHSNSHRVHADRFIASSSWATHRHWHATGTEFSLN